MPAHNSFVGPSLTSGLCWCLLQNKWVNEIVSITHAGFLLSEFSAPAHTAAHVGMLSLMFAAAEEQQGRKTYLVHSLECFAMKIVSIYAGRFADGAVQIMPCKRSGARTVCVAKHGMF